MKSIFISLLLLLLSVRPIQAAATHLWAFQSIDTMKYSRDLAREKQPDSSFDLVIQSQVTAIAETGATHVAIGTPYDKEFLPYLRRWVTAARQANLKVWFRGNFSGWEGWFGYKRITRDEHQELLKAFIVNNSDLFADGDLFSSCPECENGGPGDPRLNGDLAGHRQFLIVENRLVKLAFSQINKKIPANLNSMNGDVARLVMDKDTTQKLGGLVVIDHYVATPEKLVADIRQIAQSSGGLVILGEFGAPLPDIHGHMTEEEQAAWLGKALKFLAEEKSVSGLNYWTNTGSSTRLWDENGRSRQAVAVLKTYFSPPFLSGRVVTWFGLPVVGALVESGSRSVESGANGLFSLPTIPEAEAPVSVTAPGFTVYRQKVILGKNIYLEPLSLPAFVKHLFGLI